MLLEAGFGLAGGAEDGLFELRAAPGEPDEPAAPIRRVDLPSDIPEPFEVSQEVVDRLFRDLQLVGEIGRTAAVETWVPEERHVRP